jgi:hypothetical protein
MILEIANIEADLPFQSHRKNVFSQCGEDGIIAYLLELAKLPRGYFVEFGAWDGKHLSNCANLATEDWAGCFIEGDEARSQQLCETYASNPRIETLNAFVGIEGENALSSILKRVDAPQELTVLSMDIDGLEYHVWAALVDYRAALCIIEFNPSIPASVAYVQEPDAGLNRGASLRALWRLGQQKGYSLVAATDWNAFFMLSDICGQHRIPTYTPEQVKDTRYETALFQGYDGTLLTAGNRELIWHGVPFGAEELQILPADLRRFPVGQPSQYAEALVRFRQSRGGQ